MYSWALVAGLGTMAVFADAAEPIPQIKFEKYALPNGLEVILHVDRSAPVVATNIWYHVGSKDERPGRTGFAHLFEHLMFQGSKHHDADYFGPLEKIGARINGSTWFDRTNYFESVPANYLELALWMESDRMGFLLPALTEQRFANQRDVVKNERRQRYDNRPYGVVDEVLLAALYPPNHPYSWSVIGSMDDLDAASREDAMAFFQQYYAPNNATLVVAGHFEPAEAKRLIEKYFGSIPAGPKPPAVEAPSFSLQGVKRVTMHDRVGLARLCIEWPTVAAFSPDDAGLDILARVLGGGRTSRLHKALVRGQELAASASAYHGSMQYGGRFVVTVTPRPGKPLAEVEAAVNAEIARLQKEPPTREELDAALAQWETSMVGQLASGCLDMADQLNYYNHYTGDPGYIGKDFDRYRGITTEAVRAVADTYLTPARVVLEVLPGTEVSVKPDPRAAADAARRELARAEERPKYVAKATPPEDADRRRMPSAAAEPSFTVPPFGRAKLPNGMQLIVVEDRRLPLVYADIIFPAGRTDDPAEKAGLANLMAAVWEKGTEQRSAEQIDAEMARLGTSLSITAEAEATRLPISCLKRNLSPVLAVAADVLMHPAFPEAEVARERALDLDGLKQLRKQPERLAQMAADMLIYGAEHPYGRSGLGSPGSLNSIHRSDLIDFYRGRIKPAEATIVVVGDVSLQEAVVEFTTALGAWKGEAADQTIVTCKPEAAAPGLVLIDRPGAAQSVVAAGFLGVRRNTPDYFAIEVMNTVFAGQFMSRLNMNLREAKGYTYGIYGRFQWRSRVEGCYLTSTSVDTKSTAPAIAELILEFEGMRGKKPVTEQELANAKANLVRGYPAQFETPNGVLRQLRALLQYGLPDDYFNTYMGQVKAVDAAQVLDAGRRHLDMDHLTVVVVGDREKVEPALRELPVGKSLRVMKFDDELRLVPAK